MNNKLPRLKAPKPPLPTHKESYRPPDEMIPLENEVIDDVDFIPCKFNNYRNIKYYSPFINERFERCLDL